MSYGQPRDPGFTVETIGAVAYPDEQAIPEDLSLIVLASACDRSGVALRFAGGKSQLCQGSKIFLRGSVSGSTGARRGS